MIKKLLDMRVVLVLSVVALLWSAGIRAQAPERYDAAEIRLMLEKLNVLGTVLYVAAHPDDENTRLITWFSKEKKVSTGYFSFTRGDGGQNLIGPEMRELLGVIRTQELLAARRIDGGRQFFSRAVDFGYSKHPDETFSIWDRDQALADLVWVIRTFRPDVIVNRFNTTPGTTHGHHTASAILSKEAFRSAGDPKAFTGQLQYTDPWQPSAIYWNTYWWRRDPSQKDVSQLIACNIGAYSPLLGKSYSEIAAESRSMHKSQGFGASGSRGRRFDYLQYVDGKRAENDVFEHIDITWSRLAGGESIGRQVDDLLSAYDEKDPSGIVTGLLKLRGAVESLADDFWKERKLDEIDRLIYACTGMFLEARTDQLMAAPGELVSVSLEAINRSDVPVVLRGYRIGHTLAEEKDTQVLEYNIPAEMKTTITIPENMPYTHPYWLKEEDTNGMFEVSSQQMIGKPINDPAVTCTFFLEVDGTSYEYTRPLIYKENDRVVGEVYRPFVVGPPVFVNFSEPVHLFLNGQERTVSMQVVAGTDAVDCTVTLPLPGDWEVTPAVHNLQFEREGEEQTVQFTVRPPVQGASTEVTANALSEGEEYSRGLKVLDYDHIPYTLLFPEARATFVNVDLRKKGERIGYIMGAGDEVPASLQQIGYEVDIINGLQYEGQSLDQYDAIIAGVRALNTVEDIENDMDELMAYVRRGGVLIMQYNTTYGLEVDNFAPYPIDLSRGRVTSEDAEIRILKPEHPVLNVPNKITDRDFEGWVQERGLYFPGAWDDAYEAILSSNDPGEQPLDGGMLVARVGQGYYVYTGFSWFRQLPAGVPGAYRLFANMISLGAE